MFNKNLLIFPLSLHSIDILNNLENLSLSHPATLLLEIANIAEECMGGTSGALYCLFFTTGAKILASFKQEKDMRNVWFCAFRSGLNCLEKYGRAKVGDRTMVCTYICTLLKCIISINIYYY